MPSASIRRHKVALRGFGSARRVSAASAPRACDPEMRTTATPERPAGVASAKMVSSLPAMMRADPPRTSI
jgi:hypothetical protein